MPRPGIAKTTNPGMTRLSGIQPGRLGPKIGGPEIVRPEVGQECRAIGSGQYPGEVQHPYAGERSYSARRPRFIAHDHPRADAQCREYRRTAVYIRPEARALVRCAVLMYPWPGTIERSSSEPSKDDTMIMLLHVGRLLMVAWIVYALILLFAPHYLHHSPDNLGASVQAVTAFVFGNLMDRAIGRLRRRRAAARAPAGPQTGDTGGV